MRIRVCELAVTTVFALSTIGCAAAGVKGGSPGDAGGPGTGPGSGGAAAPSGGNGGVAGGIQGDAGGDANCGLQSFDLMRKPADVFLVLDRSGSMASAPKGSTATTSKWDLVAAAVSQVVMDTDKVLGWGLKTFPEGTSGGCSGGTVTSKIDVPVAANNAAVMTMAIAATMPTGNGTPTGDAVGAAVTYLKTLPTDRRHYLLLATDGEPTCGNGPLDARTYAVQAVTDAATAGFSTFVVGVATTKARDIMVLNGLADAGKEPRMDSDPTAPHFFLASTMNELVTSLEQITGQIPGCLFPLTTPPPVPDNIAVKVGGMPAPQDTSHQNGWDYTGPDHSAVAVFGSWCTSIEKSATNSVQVIYGCPGVVIP